MNSILPILGPFLLVVWTMATGLSKYCQRHWGIAGGILVVSLGLILLPIQGLPVHAYVRGAVGDLSITTLFLLSWKLSEQLFCLNILPSDARAGMWWIVALAGLLFYPFAMGLSPFDPYRLGYGSWILPGTLLVVTIGFWLVGRWVEVLFIPWVLLSYRFQLLESTNLWDYLLDPLVVLAAWGWGVWSGFRWIASPEKGVSDKVTGL